MVRPANTVVGSDFRPSMPRVRLAGRRATAVGFTVGLLVAVTGVAGASWVVSSVDGEARGKLAGLASLKVSPVEGEAVFPGQVMPLRVTIVSDNPVDLDVVDVELGDLKTGDDLCDQSLERSKIRFNREEVTIKPGENNVLIGRVALPTKLANSCQRKEVTAKLVVTAAYGSN